ncbi:MAG TPA: SUMF1/EgtB/PvdO family nonheme iron enzyme, partial [Blastocatellia bacterium]|nr:SUMF1/EgtB/PvdO family nonheme iron enzyme [Blastocatellia bacterium]
MKIKPFAVLLFLSVAFVGCKTQSQENSVGSRQADPHAAHHAGHLPAGSPPDAASVAAARINQTPPPGPAPEGMVWVPGGAFWMGCDDCDMPDALPVHLVTVNGFWMDATPVTNAQFQKFVDATGYKTIAER